MRSIQPMYLHTTALFVLLTGTARHVSNSYGVLLQGQPTVQLRSSRAVPDNFLRYVSSTEHHSNETQTSYEGAQVWRSALNSSDQASLIHALVDELAISLWNLKPTHADFLVHASEQELVTHRLQALGINHTIMVPDVEQRLKFLRQPVANWTKKALRTGHRFDYNAFHTLDVIEEYLSYIQTHYPSLVTLTNVGRTVENRNIRMVKISSGNTFKKGILIIAGAHGLEWASISSALFFIKELLDTYSRQPNAITNKEWYIIPLVNVDGYDYTHKVDRLWRKNRRRIGKCDGVDLNRNYGVYWDIDGVTSKEPCSSTYSGPFPFSEPESAAMREVVARLANEVAAIVSIHAYGQLVIYPWAALYQSSPDENVHHRLAEEMTMAIYNNFGTTYTYGFAYHKAEPASGTFMDYAYSEGKVARTFVFEARDVGRNGFLLPVGEIVPGAAELQTAIFALAKASDIG